MNNHIKYEITRLYTYLFHKLNMIIGRKKELLYLQNIINSPKAELVAVYGRRRIGKTYLIRAFFQEKVTFYFNPTGMNKGSKQEQLFIFKSELQKLFFTENSLPQIKNWHQAFTVLHNCLQEKIAENKNIKICIFLDELPWLANGSAELLKVIDHFWNTKFQYITQVKIILCGSATTWIIDKIINSRGGLHNRITGSIFLKPFTLKEASLYLSSNYFNWSKQDIIETYMIFGGVPYYLSLLNKTLSLHENIATLCFDKGQLSNELENLYQALFKNGEEYQKIISILSSAKSGLTRAMLLNKLNDISTGKLHKQLKELEQSGFIQIISNYKKVNRDAKLRVVDEFSLFAFNWMNKLKHSLSTTKDLWHNVRNTQSYKIWCGYAFENLCYKNIDNIKSDLGFAAISSIAYPYFQQSSSGGLSSHGQEDQHKGVQIDLLFERSDRIIVLVELKYRSAPIVINEDLLKELDIKTAKFIASTSTKKTVLVALVSNSQPIERVSSYKFAGIVNVEEWF